MAYRNAPAVPSAVLVLLLALGACHAPTYSPSFDEGIPLDQLPLTGPAPTELIMAGPDRAVITPGDHLAISVEGPDEARAVLRFARKGSTLTIDRKAGTHAAGSATLHITMPAPTSLTAAGSGEIDTPAMAPAKAEITIAGSGNVVANGLALDRLELTIAGSGSARLAGHAKALELNIAGTGNGDMAGLSVDKADITIAGTGNARLASDGLVSASIVGSGTVTVRGKAQCKVSSVGSGRLDCAP